MGGSVIRHSMRNLHLYNQATESHHADMEILDTAAPATLVSKTTSWKAVLSTCSFLS